MSEIVSHNEDILSAREIGFVLPYSTYLIKYWDVWT